MESTQNLSTPSSSSEFTQTYNLVHPNDLIQGILYRVVYDDDKIDEGINLIFHEKQINNNWYGLTREDSICLNDEDNQPKYNYIFTRENGERTTITAIYIYYKLVRFYSMSTEYYIK